MNVLNDPTHGAEDAASADPSEISGDAQALAALLDNVIEENRRLSEAVNRLDVERLAQARAFRPVTYHIRCFALRLRLPLTLYFCQLLRLLAFPVAPYQTNPASNWIRSLPLLSALVAQACIGWGTDDKEFIQVITTRSKRYLSQISKGYRQSYDKDLLGLINAECSGWYAYLARFIVLPPAQSDLRLLDLAMDGLGSNKVINDE